MNHYRFRLILATASLTAALTVLALKVGGFISHPDDRRTMLTVSSRYSGQKLSPYLIDCTQQFARLEYREQAGAPLWLLDPLGQIISCKRGDQAGLANP
jgi:hypothetical protein